VLHPERAASSSLRFIRSASAAMPRQVLTDLERVFRVPFLEAYGMTEAGPQIASNRLPPHERKPGSVGPAAGPDVAIMNDAGHLLATGETGEIVIRGPNVMRAYENNAAANRSAFTRGWFRTGDIGHLDADGYLFITGRLKEIINRGGEKIAPREVEEVLLGHPAVAQAVTFAVPHPTLGENVAAAIVLRGSTPVTAAEIRQFATTRLAHFKVPQQVVIVKEIPQGPTGKLQRIGLAEKLGLAAPGAKQAKAQADFAPPRTPLEESLAGILASVLGLERVGIHDNFFQLGGHSLMATQVIARLQHQFQVELPLQSLFDRPTVAELGELVAQRLAGERAARTQNRPREAAPASGTATIPRRSTIDPCPLSFAQQRLWFLDRVEPGNPAYNMLVALRLVGALHVPTLEQSLNEILRRHEALRTTFPTIGGQPVQAIAPAKPRRLPVVDLTSLPACDRQGEALRLAAEEAGLPFHLARGPLARATLLRLDAEEHILLFAMHHIISDGWSTQVLYRELETLYDAFAAGRASPLPDLPIQYADFAVWQREWLHGRHGQEGGGLEAQLAYWKEQLGENLPVLDLPTDRSRPDLQTYRGARQEMVIPHQVTEGLKALSQREGATLFMTLLAAFQTLLFRYSGQDDLVVGTPIANRTRVETEGLIGFFANTLVLRTDLSGHPSFRRLLGRVRATALGAFAHQDLPFEKLVEELQPERDPRHTPLFRVMFAFQNIPGGLTQRPLVLAPGLTARPLQVDSGTAKFDLTLYLSETEQGLAASWQYNSELFEAATIERMGGHFQTLLAGILADPERRLSELPLLTEAERHQLLRACNPVPPHPHPPSGRLPTGDPAPASGERCFHHLFEEQVERTPDAVAVLCDPVQLTYGELNGHANQLARRLQRLGVGPDTRVGVCLTRSAEMVVALLGVLKAGGAYVPLDPEYPRERLAFLLEDARVPVLVTEERLRDQLPQHSAAVVCLESDRDNIARESRQNVESLATAANLAYVIYTSGSTGQPKGVMITHGNVSHYCDAMRGVLRIAAGDRYLHTASFAFSSSARQFMLPLSCGAAIVVATTAQIRDPRALFEVIQQHGVSILDVVPSYWRSCTQLLAHLEPASRAALLDNQLRLILSASEPLLWDVPTGWSRFGHGAQLINMFGQTETTGIVTTYPIPAGEDDSVKVVPIGRPIANTQVYLLDSFGQLVPLGVKGEMYIGGAGVGKGYLNQPELTAHRFVPDPFSATPGARLYRTGDVARYLPDGKIEFFGRRDQQIKVRGFRVEPGEIEAVLRQHPGVRESVVVAQREGRSEERGTDDAHSSADTLPTKLVAYVVPERRAEVRGPGPTAAGGEQRAESGSGSPLAPDAPTPAELREFLKQKLPAYMVPSSIVEVTTLPLTPNGKVDRKALSSHFVGCPPLGARPELGRACASPRTAAEETLASLWAQLLGVDRVGIDDNFFELGGNSLLGIQMIDRANQAGLRLRPGQLFQHQTIAQLAAAAVSEPLASADCGVRTAESSLHSTLRSPHAAVPPVRVSVESLRAYGREALERTGLPPEVAAIVTEVQLEASLRGQPTHNMGAIPDYARRLVSGAMNSRPHFRVERETAISARVDGDDGPGQWVGVRAMELAIQKARQSGVGVVGARRSNHFGAAGHYAWLAARENLIGWCTTNSRLSLAPTGGLTPTFGNNPLGVGIPAAQYHPIVLDIAMSVAARGKIGLHLAEGKPLPPGWILDRFGRPSTDPADLVAGLGVPIGGHKGYGLTLVMEALAGVLTGAGFCWDHRREPTRPSVAPLDYGHFFMAIDPELFMPVAEFTARVDRMIEQAKGGDRAENVEEILVPGETEMRARTRNLREGVPLLASTYRALRKYREEAVLNTELVVVG
jgi:amino acid adenylation domain-containing protein